jgi:hypothetical protein
MPTTSTRCVDRGWRARHVGVPREPNHLAEAGRRVRINDLWIAAIAASRGLAVITQDGDFDALDGVAGLTVIRV